MDAKNNGMVFVGMGFELVACILGAMYVGGLIDKYFAWPGIATISLIVLFFIGWVVHIVVLLKRFTDDSESSGS
jgi:hypothetical protein